MTFGRWLAGLVGVGLVLGAAAVAARALRVRLVPGLGGAVALLADAVLTVALLVVLLQVLGVVGLLEGWAIVGAAVAGGGAVAWLGRGTLLGERAAPSRSVDLLTVLAWLGAGVVVAAWLRRTLVSLDLGMGGVDTLWYHMPFATRFAQEGSIAAAPYVDLEFLTAFYPANVELLHAGGLLAFDGDALSPWLSLAALALALLAGWCAGAVRGAGPIGLLATACVFAVPSLFDSQAGEAKNDTFALATLLAAAAFLLAARGRVSPGLALLAGLSAGLAVGTKLSFLAPVGALTVAVAVIAPRGRRGRVFVAWAGGLFATSGFWYLRNLALTGNPLPWLDLGPLPQPAEPRSAATADPLSDYLFDGDAWDEHFLPGLEASLGPAWWALLGLAAVGALFAVLDRDRTVRALGVVAIVTAAAYVVTPSTAAGPEGEPIGFPLNVRYLTPALLLGLCLLAGARPGRRATLLVVAALGAVLVVTQFADSIWALEHRRKAIAALLAGIALVAAARYARPPRWVVAALAGLAVVAAGWPLSRDHDRQAYAGRLPPYTSWSGFDLDAAFAWARDTRGARIAVTGTTGAFFQYPLTGRRLDSEVRLLGDRGPHGSFTPLRDCAAFRRALAGFTHVVTTPDLDIWDPYRPRTPREPGWLEGTGARPVVAGERVTVYALPPETSADGCERP